MKVCIVGAGAIGGQLAVRLAGAGAEVSLLVRREAQRAAIAASGLTLLRQDGTATQIDADALRVATDCAALGPQDLVVLALKTHQLRAVVPAIRDLFATETAVLSLQNGIPWWYFQRHGGAFEGHALAALDPDGAIAASIEPSRIIGSVTYMAGEVVGPGTVRHGGGERLPIGELDGSKSERVAALAALLTRAGLQSPVAEDIRAEIWFKVWANSCMNPVGALTHGAVGAIAGSAETHRLLCAMMEEVGAIAGRLGVRLRGPVEERIGTLKWLAAHKPSMLQDVEAGRPLEIEAVLGVLVELARLTGTPTPHLDTVYACAKLLDKSMAAEHCGFAPRPAAQ